MNPIMKYLKLYNINAVFKDGAIIVTDIERVPTLSLPTVNGKLAMINEEVKTRIETMAQAKGYIELMQY